MIWILTTVLILSWVLITCYIFRYDWNEAYKLQKDGAQKEHKPATDLRSAFRVAGSGGSFPLLLFQNAMIVPHNSLLPIRKGTTGISCVEVRIVKNSGTMLAYFRKLWQTRWQVLRCFLEHVVINTRGVSGQTDRAKTRYLSDFDKNREIAKIESVHVLFNFYLCHGIEKYCQKQINARQRPKNESTVLPVRWQLRYKRFILWSGYDSPILLLNGLQDWFVLLPTAYSCPHLPYIHTYRHT